MCETSELPAVPLRAPNRHPSFYPQSQRAPRDDAKLAVSRIRHNSTQSNRIQQNPTKIRVCARARGNGVPFPFSRHGLPPRHSGFDASLGGAAPSRHANRPNGTPSFQLVAYNSRVCYYFPRIGERRQS